MTTLQPDKGQKDGSCNRTACQRPLKGHPQWTMRDHMTGGKLYYCQSCAFKFNDYDDSIRVSRRCVREEPQASRLTTEQRGNG